MELAAGIAAVSNAITIAKALRELDKSYAAAGLKAQTVDLLDNLTNAKLALIEANEALVERDREIARLKTAFEDKANLVRGRGGYHYKAGADGKPDGYPVCPKCEQMDGRIVQLVQDGGMIHGRCPVCSSTYSPVSCFVNSSGQAADDVERDRVNALINGHKPNVV